METPGTMTPRRGQDGDDGTASIASSDYDAHARRFTAAELKGVLHQNWPGVLRAAKRVERYGRLTVPLLLTTITNELCFVHRDVLALQEVLREAERDGLVSIAELRLVVSTAHWESSPVRPPPFAVNGDATAGGARRRTLEERQAEFRSMLLKAADGQTTLSRSAFNAAVNRIARFGISDREATDLFSTLDPRKTGFVNVDDFCRRFTVEFLKPKSMRPTLGARGSDGSSSVFEWPVSLTAPHPGTPIKRRAHTPRGRRTPASRSSPRSTTKASHAVEAPPGTANTARGPVPPPPPRLVPVTTSARGTTVPAAGGSDLFGAQRAASATRPPPGWSPRSTRSSALRRQVSTETDGEGFRALNAAGHVPQPPPRPGKVKTAIVADAALLGNVPASSLSPRKAPSPRLAVVPTPSADELE